MLMELMFNSAIFSENYSTRCRSHSRKRKATLRSCMIILAHIMITLNSLLCEIFGNFPDERTYVRQNFPLLNMYGTWWDHPWLVQLVNLQILQQVEKSCNPVILLWWSLFVHIVKAFVNDREEAVYYFVVLLLFIQHIFFNLCTYWFVYMIIYCNPDILLMCFIFNKLK